MNFRRSFPVFSKKTGKKLLENVPCDSRIFILHYKQSSAAFRSGPAELHPATGSER